VVSYDKFAEEFDKCVRTYKYVRSGDPKGFGANVGEGLWFLKGQLRAKARNVKRLAQNAGLRYGGRSGRKPEESPGLAAIVASTTQRILREQRTHKRSEQYQFAKSLHGFVEALFFNYT